MMKRTAIALLAIGLLTGCDSGPKFEGKSQSGWIKELGSENSAQVDSAIEKLGNGGDAAVPILVAALSDERASVPDRAAQALGRIGEPAVDELRAILNSTDPKAPKAQAANAFSYMGDPGKAATEDLIKAMNAGDAQMTRNAQKALKSIGPAAVEPLFNSIKSDETYSTAVYVLVETGTEVIPHVLQYTTAEDERLRRAATEVISFCGSDYRTCLEPMIVASKDADGRTRNFAVSCLARMDWGGETVISALVAALQDPQYPIRQTAISGLSRFGDRANQAVPMLITMFSQGSVGQEALLFFGRMGEAGRPAVPLMIQALEYEQLQPAAADALGNLGPIAQEATPHLLSYLEKSPPEKRRTLAISLGRIQSPEALSPLMQFADRKDGYYRQSGIEALGAMGPQARAAREIILESLGPGNERMLRVSAIEAMVSIFGKDAAVELEENLSDDANLMRAAAQALAAEAPEIAERLSPGVTQSKSSVPTKSELSAVMAGADVGRMAELMNAITKTEPASAEFLPVVAEHIDSPHWKVRELVAKSLPHFGEEGVQVIRQALESGSPELERHAGALGVMEMALESNPTDLVGMLQADSDPFLQWAAREAALRAQFQTQ